MENKQIKLHQFLDQLELVELVSPKDDQVVTGCYVSDLLSWVMSHAKANELWLTVQTHPNVVAIGSLLELGGIVIVEDAEIPELTIEKAKEEGLALYQTKKSAADLIIAIHDL